MTRFLLAMSFYLVGEVMKSHLRNYNQINKVNLLLSVIKANA